MYTILYMFFRAGDAQGNLRKRERTQAGVLITGTFIYERRKRMKSFGARFSEEEYIKVDIDFETGESVVTMITETDGTPVTATGSITWDEGE